MPLDIAKLNANGWIRRHGVTFFLMFVAVLFGLVAVTEQVVPKPIENLANLFFCTAIGLIPIWLGYRLRKTSRGAMFFLASGCLIIISQYLAVAEDTPYFFMWPIIGRFGSFYLPFIDNLLLGIAMIALVASSYVALVQAADHGAAMDRQRAGLEDALKKAYEYAEALRDSEQRFIGLADDAPVIIWTADARGRVNYLNQAWTEATGALPEEGFEGRWMDWVHPEDREQLLKLNRTVRDSRNAAEVRFRLRSKNGRYRHWRGKSMPVFSSHDGEPGFLGLCIDITDLIEAQEAYKSLVSNSLQGMIIVQNGVIVFANPAMEEIVGVSRRELHGFSMDQVNEGIHRDDRESLWKVYENLLSGDYGPCHHRWRFFRRDGTMRWIEAETTAVRYRGEKAVQSLILDNTEAMLAESALRESEERLGLVIQATQDGIYDVRLLENRWWFSEKYAEVLGDTPTYPDGHSYDVWLNRLHPDDYDDVVETYAKALEERKTSWESTHRMRRRDGTYGYFRDNCVIVWGPDGSVQRNVGAVKDVTAEKVATIRLEAVAEVAQALIENQLNDLALDVSAQILCTKLRYDVCAVFGYDAVSGGLTRRGEHAVAGAAPLDMTNTRLQSLVGRCVSIQEICGDQISPTSLLVCVPLVDEEKTIGILLLQACEVVPIDALLRQTLMVISTALTQWLVSARTQIELDTSEKRYAMATAAASVGVLDWDIDRDVLYVDPVLEELMGFERPHDREWSMGDAGALLASAEYLDAGRAQMTAAILGDTNELRLEAPFRAQNGEIRWLFAHGTVLRDEGGRARRMVGTAIDITQRKHAELALDRQRTQLLTLADNLPALVSYLGSDGRYRFVNRRYVEWFGLPRELMEGKSPEEVVGNEAFSRARQYHERAQRGEKVRFEERFHVRGRGLRWLASEFIPTPSLGDGQDGYIALINDITDAKLAEEALINSQKLLAESQRIGKMGSWLWRPGQTCLEASDELFRIHGIQPVPNPEARIFLRMIHADDRPYIRGLTQTRLLDGVRGEHVYRIVRSDGEERVLRAWTEMERDDDGTVLRVVGVTQDITEQIALEERVIEAAESERRRFGEDLHDDIGQYLTGMVLIARSLARTLREHGLPESASAEDLERHIQHCRERARAVARGLRPIPQERNGLLVALHDLCTQLEDLFHVTCSLECHVELVVEDVTAATHLFRIAQEAATNAVHHGKATEIKFELDVTDAELLLVVKDNGRGLRPDWRATRGNGLNIMQHRASLLHGTLHVQDDVLGGVCVVCSVPVSSLEHRRSA